MSNSDENPQNSVSENKVKICNSKLLNDLCYVYVTVFSTQYPCIESGKICFGVYVISTMRIQNCTQEITLIQNDEKIILITSFYKCVKK